MTGSFSDNRPQDPQAVIESANFICSVGLVIYPWVILTHYYLWQHSKLVNLNHSGINRVAEQVSGNFDRYTL